MGSTNKFFFVFAFNASSRAIQRLINSLSSCCYHAMLQKDERDFSSPCFSSYFTGINILAQYGSCCVDCCAFISISVDPTECAESGFDVRLHQLGCAQAVWAPSRLRLGVTSQH